MPVIDEHTQPFFRISASEIEINHPTQQDRIESDYKFLKERLSWINKTVDRLYELAIQTTDTSESTSSFTKTDRIYSITECLDDIRRDQTSFNVILDDLRRNVENF